jgi:glutathione S-transferase
MEMVTVPWWFIGLSGGADNPLEGWFQSRLQRLSAVLSEREWLAAGRFTVADLLMADVLRVPKVLAAAGAYPVLPAYVARVCERPAFKRAHEAQMAHFANAD